MVPAEDLTVVTPADWVPGPTQGLWTYDDYAALPEDGQRYEIVNGVLVMAPAPSPEHQAIVVRLAHYLFAHVELAQLGRVFTSPIDVELGPKHLYQPDIVVVLKAHEGIIHEKKIVGVPDLMIEVTSPSTAAFDRLTKYEIYARAGIAEYWIVKPTARSIDVMVLDAGEYRLFGTFTGKSLLPSQVIPNLPVQVEQFFV
jgi:Uma2 family endonuclease